MQNRSQIKKQAAKATFEHILNLDQLAQAIDMIDIYYTGHSTSNLIDYINKVGDQFGIDKSVRKTLYPKFFSYLNNASSDTSTAPAINTQTQKKPPIDMQPLNNSPVSTNTDTSDSTPDKPDSTNPVITEVKNPKMTVFLYFVERLIYHFPSDPNELFEEVSNNVKNEKSFTDREKKEIVGWLNKPKQYQSFVGISEKAMSSLIHLFYISLCDFLGPSETDELFYLILGDCNQLTAAKEFDPRRFL